MKSANNKVLPFKRENAMKQFEDKSFNHILLQVVGPVLIMLMVSSLVFFLIEVIYRGPHTGRLYWVMGLFTFASVLVARISIEEGRERSLLFGLALAIATLITSLQLIEFSFLAFLSPVVLIGLIVVVMWTSNKLTWDCTVVDSSRDISSSGMLERLKRSWTDAVDEVDHSETPPSRMRQLFLSGAKSNSPGTWVCYFALVAFPVFGFGQWFVRPQSNSWIYVLFAVYFGAALGLLLTTSLLGLERYLMKRQVSVPAPIARNWMVVGGVFALAIIMLVSLLPKPSGSNSLQNAMAALSTPLKKASRFAQGDDGQKDEPDANKKKIDPDAERSDDKGKDGDEPGQEEGDGGKSKDGKDGESEEESKRKSDASQQKQRPDNQQQPQESKQSSKQENATKDENREQKRSEKNSDSKASNKQQPQKRADNKKRDVKQQPPPQQPRTRQSKQSKPSSLQALFDKLSTIMNWLVYLVGAVAAIVLLFLFRKDLANLWSLLFGKRGQGEEAQEASQTSRKPTAPPQPFSRFKNPFAPRKATQSLVQLVHHSMLALEAWGRDFGYERGEHETPMEYARRLEVVEPQVSRQAIEMAKLYNVCAFSGKTSVDADVEPLKKLWERMTATYNKRIPRERATVSSAS